jgi:hypothetical protein
VVVVRGAIEADEIFPAHEGLHKTGVNEFIGVVIAKAAVFVLFWLLADSCLDRVLVYVPDDGEELVLVVDRPALERGLKQTADARIFLVEIVHITGRNVLENAAEGHLTDFDDEVEMICHKGVAEEFEIAD